MSPSETYDLVILGGGAAAFAAITEADRRDRSTALVNTGLPLGGTCVNVGCVPSKHLLEVGKTAFEPPRTPFKGVSYDDDQPQIDWPAAIDEKDDLVAALRQENYVNVAERFDTDVYEGYGRFVDDTTIEIVPDGAEADPARTDAATRRITGERALIATGSSPRIPPIEGIEDVPYETSE
ncbi:MAG: FAD-dependent oxidoreductase, partial [Halodesulfurarchaeum sp.]